MRKRVLSGVLSLAMLLTLTPAAAFASEAEPPPDSGAQSDEIVLPEGDHESNSLSELSEQTKSSDMGEGDSAIAESEEGTSSDQTSPSTNRSDASVEDDASAEDDTIVEEDEPFSPYTAVPAPQSEVGETHIATYVGQVPAELEGKDGVTAGQFSTAYETVMVTVDGIDYTVEVVPENLVYFIDQIDYNSSTISKPYEAVKTLVPGLLNDKYDQQSSDGSWGLVSGLDAGKSNVNVNDKNLTGLYGKNGAGSQLIYALPLEAGKYTITTLHHEWWGGQNRSMDLSLTTDAGTETYASLPKMDNGQEKQEEYSFEIAEDQTVTLTITATGNQGPVISWLGVVRTGDVEKPDDSAAAGGDCGDQGGNVDLDTERRCSYHFRPRRYEGLLLCREWQQLCPLVSIPRSDHICYS